MSTAVLPESPDISEPPDPAEEVLPPDQLGKYSVGDRRFVRRAAEDLMARCDRNHVPLPDSVIAALALPEAERNESGMFRALLRIEDLEDRRRAICQMVHEIVRLK